MDMTRQGWSRRRFQASQQRVTVNRGKAIALAASPCVATL